MKKGQLVHVIWHDAETTAEWKSEEDLQDHDSTLCETVGFLVKTPAKKDLMFIIASTQSHDKKEKKVEYNAIIKIPRVWVKEIKVYK